MGMGTGTGPPSLPPSPTAAGANCQRAARPHGFVAFLPLVINVPSCFRDAGAEEQPGGLSPLGMGAWASAWPVGTAQEPLFFQ